MNYRFRRQFVIEPYLVDFISLDLKLIIELDGSQHHEQREQDAERTLFLNQHGFKVVRYCDNEVLNNLDAVLEELPMIVEQRENDLKISPPNPNVIKLRRKEIFIISPHPNPLHQERA